MVGGQDGRAQVDGFLRGADGLEGLVEVDAGRGLAAGGARMFADSWKKGQGGVSRCFAARWNKCLMGLLV